MIDIDPATFKRWRDTHEDFRNAHARCKAIQNDFFVQGLAQGIMNPTGAIFVAKNVLGWRDKVDIEQTTTTVEGTPLMAQCLGVATPEERQLLRNLLETLRARVLAVSQVEPHALACA